MNNSRRRLLKVFSAFLATMPLRGLAATAALNGETGNFHYIYGNATYRREFLDFLKNVFHLYPEDSMHELISEVAREYSADRDIYANLQRQVAEIKPFLSELTYAVPALNKQKDVMAGQTVELLPAGRRFENYLEIGSTGRYLDALEERLDIAGEAWFVHSLAPTYSPVDIVDRGQIHKAGQFINLNDYRPGIGEHIPAGSVDLVTVYIGFHHCPLELREEFITSIRDVMKPGASLILRDHNAHDEKMRRMVALAHDVFNMGTNETWAYNEAELRNFYSLDTLDEILRRYGFKSDGRRLFQDGDPTLNALMLYKKV